MKRVLFLQPPSPPHLDVFRDYAGGFGVALPTERREQGHGPYSLPYVSLMYSAGIMSQLQWDIAYVDAQAERMSLESTLTRVCEYRPDVIVSVVNLPSIYEDARILLQLKNHLPHTKIVAIGTVCRVLPEVLAGLKAFDFIILGEPESVLPVLLENIRKEANVENVRGIGLVDDGEILMTEPMDELIELDQLPWPPYDIMPTSHYRTFIFKKRSLPVWASRGCFMPCSFYCPYPVGLGKLHRLRQIDDFVGEIAYLKQKFGVSAFIFRDQIFSSNIDRAEEICDMLIAKRLKVQWLCETRLDLVNEKLLKKMTKAGCKRIHFGLETGDPEHLRRIGKPGMKLSTVKDAIRMTKRAGIVPLTHLIVGLPGETQETIRRTLMTIREMGLTQVSVNLATPYPGTPLFKFVKKKDLLETEDWSRYTSFDAVMRTEEMTAQELKAAQMFISKHLLGLTLPQKFYYLCKNRGIIDAIVRRSLHMWHNPLSIFRFFKGLRSE